MLFHIDRTAHGAQFPQGGVLPLVGQSQLTACIDHSSHNHRQAIPYPGLRAGIECLIQFQLFGQLQQGVTGSVFFRADGLEGFRGVLGHDLTTEGRLNELELIELQPGDATVIGMFDFAIFAERRAQDADGIGAVALNFQVDGACRFQQWLPNTMYNNGESI